MIRPKQKSNRELPRKSRSGSLPESDHVADGANHGSCDAGDPGNTGDTKRLGERVRELENLLMQEQLLRKQLLLDADQEVITPIHTIVGMLNLLLETDLTTEQREFTESARFTGTHLIQVITQHLEKLQNPLVASSSSSSSIISPASPLNITPSYKNSSEGSVPSKRSKILDSTPSVRSAPSTPSAPSVPSTASSPVPPGTGPSALEEKFSTVPATRTSCISPPSTPDSSDSPGSLPSSILEHSEGSRSSLPTAPSDVAPSSTAALAVKDSEGVKKRLHRFSVEISPAGVFAIWHAFLQAVPSYLDQLEKALLAGEGVQVNSLACTLSRACLNLGAEGIVELCRRLENLKIAGREPEAWHLFKEIKKSFERLTALPVPGYRNSPPSGPSGDI
ncbi:MAG: Hpt domain-containing protein [Candidatus Ozemobacteraceae bacterium]